MQIAAEFVTSAASAGDFPRDHLTEVALVGRSNVGKSSLINALVRQPLARTSAAPGKTRLVNYYRVQRGSMPALYLVDLPGYGYARAPRQGTGRAERRAKDARDAAAQEFNALADAYFARARGSGGADHRGPTRDAKTEGPFLPSERDDRGGAQQGEAVRDGRRASAADRRGGASAADRRGGASAPPKDIAVLLLVDSRHPRLESDLDAWDWVSTQGIPCGIVGTKVDKLTRAERVRHARAFESSFDAPVLLVSAQSGEGLEELWKLIARLPKETAA